jgi:hypothetical protein
LDKLQKADFDPKQFYTQEDEILWKFIRQECPNYFFKPPAGKIFGEPNHLAKTLFSLFRCDLIGMVFDYAQEALVQEWVSLDTGKLIEPEQMHDPEVFRVYMEVDTLEQALTLRATLRATAAKIIRQMGMLPVVERSGKLTDTEVDELLRLVYSSNWPDDKPMLYIKVTNYLAKVNSVPFEERLASQLKLAIEDSQTTIIGLRNGTIKPINRENEPSLEGTLDSTGKTVDNIMHDPLHTDLFLKLVDAEKRNLEAAIAILKPVFETDDYVLNEEVYEKINIQLASAGYFDHATTEVENEFNV